MFGTPFSAHSLQGTNAEGEEHCAKLNLQCQSGKNMIGTFVVKKRNTGMNENGIHIVGTYLLSNETRNDVNTKYEMYLYRNWKTHMKNLLSRCCYMFYL